MKRAASSFSAGSSALTAFSSAFAASRAPLRQRQRLLAVGRQRLGDGRLERLQPLAADIDVGEPRGELRGDRREIVDRDLMLAAGGAQRKEPLFAPLQFVLIEVAGADRRFEPAARLLQIVERRAERCDGRLKQARKLRRLPLEPPREARRDRGSARRRRR